MGRIHINNMMIEITRECNLACAHCLRGEAQSRVIPDAAITSLFSQVSHINLLTISGGEPSLYPEKIKTILEEAKRHRTSVGSFYLATNGVTIPDEFIIAVIELWMYCEDNEVSKVHISNDYFHEYQWEDGYKKLKALSFVHKKYQDDGYNYNNFNEVIYEGRGKEFGHCYNDEIAKKDLYSEETEISDVEFYLNALGHMIIGCNWSYESQDMEENILCYIEDFTIECKKIYQVERI